MRKIRRYLHLYRKYISMAIKSKIAYRVDTFVGVFGFLVTNAINFAALFLTVYAITSIDGYSIENMAFLYGLCLIPKGIDHILTDNLWTLSQRYVIKGELDKYLTKPISPFFQIVAETFQLEGFGEVILGTTFLCVFGPAQGLSWSAMNVCGLIIAELLTCLLFFNIKVIGSCLSFWTKRSNSVLVTIYNLNDTARYPITVFKNDVIKGILLYVVPYSLFIFCPIACVFSATGTIDYVFGINMNILQIDLILLSFIIIFSAISYLLWNKGKKRYESAGS